MVEGPNKTSPVNVLFPLVFYVFHHKIFQGFAVIEVCPWYEEQQTPVFSFQIPVKQWNFKLGTFHLGAQQSWVINSSVHAG